MLRAIEAVLAQAPMAEIRATALVVDFSSFTNVRIAGFRSVHN